MDPIERLAALFEKFPGIGPRQAGRFVRYLLRVTSSTRRELADSIQKLGSTVRECPGCMRFHSGKSKQCSICADTARDGTTLAVVASDTDLEALEKSGTYKGRYFVLGGTVSLASDKPNGLHIKELLAHINDIRSRYADFKEIILAFPANPEGDATASLVRDEVNDFVSRSSVKITTLGRGLSTGSELEYADPETIKGALENRH
jgi:recombination protein RecR